MNYINKIQLPENISSINDVNKHYDQNINDLITYLFKKTKFNKHDILNYYKAYFKNIINKKIQDDYINLIEKFSNSILPIILKSRINIPLLRTKNSNNNAILIKLQHSLH